MAASQPSAAVYTTPFVTGSGDASTATRRPSLVAWVARPSPPPSSAAAKTIDESACQAVAIARTTAAGGRMKVWAVSQSDATPGTRVATNSITARIVATPITNGFTNPASTPGSGPTHPE